MVFESSIIETNQGLPRVISVQPIRKRSPFFFSGKALLIEVRSGMSGSITPDNAVLGIKL
ncbi:hypothetical protein D3C73_1616780 [compost metagenome]